jgi:hypothetical protein
MIVTYMHVVQHLLHGVSREDLGHLGGPRDLGEMVAHGEKKVKRVVIIVEGEKDYLLYVSWFPTLSGKHDSRPGRHDALVWSGLWWPHNDMDRPFESAPYSLGAHTNGLPSQTHLQ